MNAKGLVVMLSGVSDSLNSHFFDNLKGVHADELAGTRSDAAALVKLLHKTPEAKIEKMVAKYDPQLTAALSKFQKEWQSDTLKGFRDAQIMLGHVTTVMAKSGLKG
jgi:ATP-dependent protease HslVU (ClpYQ) peptidase subunit